MSFFDLKELAQSADLRIVKTKIALFDSLIALLKTHSINEIKITDLCEDAMINRKTFYSHYSSVNELMADLEKMIVKRYLSLLVAEKIITPKSFDAAKFIVFTNTLVEENSEKFQILFNNLRNGGFMHELGAQAGMLVLEYTKSLSSESDVMLYMYTFVFAITGLITSYFDWLDFGKMIPIEDLVWTVNSIFSSPFNFILSNSHHIPDKQ